MEKPKIFISHITEEAEIANLFKQQIQQDFLGMFDVFVSSDDSSIDAGSKWLDKVSDALQKTKVQLVICSHQSIYRPWINFEAGATWVKGIPVIPICHTGLRPSLLPIPLNMLQGIVSTDENGLKKNVSSSSQRT